VNVRRVLVLGAHGQLGQSIVRAFADAEVLMPRRTDLDITDPASVARIVRDAAPELIVNCAAFNDVDGAEDQPVAAFDANAFAVRSLARAAEATGAPLVHFSTDFVFDGEADRAYDEEATPAPRSVYAMSKLVGEWFALDAPRAFVLRVESLFGTPHGWPGRRSTLDGIVDGLEQGRVVRVFTDRVVSPSYVEDVAAATRYLVAADAPMGLYHCVNSGQATWLEVARETSTLLDVTPCFDEVSMAQVTLKASRPRFCALANRKLADAGFLMPPWQDALRRWLAGRRPIT
jgi:dTDP-4-dehydrorhamnose reductase